MSLAIANDESLRVAHELLWEQPTQALAHVWEIETAARRVGDVDQVVSALALQGRVMLVFGRMDAACDVMARIGSVQGPHQDLSLTTRVVFGTFAAQLSFFLGSYREALTSAVATIAAADVTGNPFLRLMARAGTCIVLGNLRAPALHRTIEERLEIACSLGATWDEAVGRNDNATILIERGDPAAALVELDRAVHCADRVTGPSLTIRAVINATRAELLSSLAKHDDAVAYALEAVRLTERPTDRYPYVTALTANTAVTTLTAAGEFERACSVAATGLGRLRDLLPLSRSEILSAMAVALRGCGRVDEACTALAECVELERSSARQLALLQEDLSGIAAQHEQLRELATDLRDKADRDWLTGVHNRRYLERLDLAPQRAVGIAMIDLDDFKSVNDVHGHDVGDMVLARVAQLLVVATRPGDTVIRFGGDEFLVVMPDIGAPALSEVCDRIGAAIADEPWDEVAGGLRVGGSVGAISGPAGSFDDLVREADGRMFAAKRADGGRGNRERRGATTPD